MHQMGLQMGHDKVEYNNTVEESSLVPNCNECSDQQVQHALKSPDQRYVDFCTPTTLSTLDIIKVHNLFPLCSSVSPKYSHALILTTVQVENDSFIIILVCIILFVMYSSKLCAVVSLCLLNVCVRYIIDYID